LLGPRANFRLQEEVQGVGQKTIQSEVGIIRRGGSENAGGSERLLLSLLGGGVLVTPKGIKSVEGRVALSGGEGLVREQE